MRIGRERVWIALAAAAGLVLLLAAARLLFHSDDDAAVRSRTDDVVFSSAGEPAEAVIEPILPDQEDPASLIVDPSAEGSDQLEALPPGGVFLSGTVIDKQTRRPVPAFSLRMCRRIESGTERWKEFFAEKIEHAEGRFLVPLKKGGRIRLWVQSAAHQEYRTDLDVPEETGLADQEFELDPGATAAGIVLDDATGQPVAGALVAHADVYGTEDLMRLLLGQDTWTAHAVSGKDGRFRLTGLDEAVSTPWLDGKWRIAAAHPDYAEGVARCAPAGGAEVTIRLEPGYRIFGRVLDDGGNPAGGAVVCISSREIPLPRPVLTGADGSYRTAPALPGLVFVSVGPPPGRAGDCPDLTEETRRVKIENGDVEVDFGPSPDHVTWRGTVRHRDGSPMPRAAIKLAPAEAELEEKIQNRLERRVACDEEGRFEIRRLAAKSYVVDVSPSSWAHDIDLGKLAFEKPGLVKRDICITGAEIRGIVVIKGTEGPIGKGGWVSCFTHDDGLIRHFSCPVDEEGRFALLGLPAGTHRVVAHAAGYPSAAVEGIVLEEEEICEDVRIEVFAGGWMNIKVSGFRQGDARDFRWTLGLKGGQQFYFGNQHLDADGCWEINWDREPGVYVTSLDFAGIGTVVREFEIFAGRTTTVLIDRSHAEPQEGTVTVSGTVTRADGAPAAKARVVFFCQQESGREPNERVKSGVADESGHYHAAGFWPGSWTVSAHGSGGSEVNFPELVIPHDAPAVVVLDLVMAAGTITGTLRDGKTGRPLEKNGALWWVFLRDVKTGRTVVEIQGGHTGDRFTLEGVPEGEFMVLVSARGYRDSSTGPHKLGTSGYIDVGDIVLDPCGILLIEVMDQRGDPISDFALACDGGPIHPWDREEVSPGRFRYFSLPAGKITLLVTAEGYLGQEIPVTLEPGVPGEVRVVLTAK